MKFGFVIVAAALFADLSYAHCKEATSLINKYKCGWPKKTVIKTKTAWKTRVVPFTITQHGSAVVQVVTVTQPAAPPVTETETVTVTVSDSDNDVVTITETASAQGGVTVTKTCTTTVTEQGY
ncbi:hypothetical protein H072_7235 [Dactylellina haptotyla CBS 200.50]|uniref:Uncharacterized protein n=1 Tax=Dactylellina haptotyla (strain CBS 200.50) TaxID=1284197 RepID=S8A7M5_DACHA|nr:hypothetical protein H072_7235 [Dactylellina haptotyla CBS 200.50]